ncbi:MAG: Ppx/GppA family phosphatase [Proteobacteria bacterium]|nr:MAG: Ppx/GppA family phosphatase [Pseudomonadota bacterium]
MLRNKRTRKKINRLNFQPKNPLAVIDLGSNTFHLAITTLDEDGHIHVIDTQKDHLRLAEMLEDGYIPAKLFKRSAEALLAMKSIGESYNAQFRLVATQAIRSAHNRLAFIEHIRKATGLDLEIIDGVEEARLSFLGVIQGLHFADEAVMTVDIGGASTEIACGRASDCNYLSSLKIGALLLSKRYLFAKEPKEDAINDLKQIVEARLLPVQEDLINIPIQHAAVTSGTAKAIARMVHWDKNREELDDAHGYLITAEELFRIEKEINQLKTSDRIAARWSLESRRADIILAGVAILAQLTRVLKIPRWKVSASGLREGVATDTYERQGLLPANKWQDLRWHTIQGLAKKLSLDPTFSLSTSQLATQIFDRFVAYDEFKIRCKNPAIDRDLLKAAAYLLEAGKFINFSSYHKHTYYLITEMNLLGFTQEEKHVLGLVNRYARKAPPKHGKSDALPYLERNFNRVCLLSSCLRIARSLLRTRQIKTHDFTLTKAGNKYTLVLKVAPDQRLDAEKIALQKEIKNLEKALNVEFDFRLEP